MSVMFQLPLLIEVLHHVVVLVAHLLKCLASVGCCVCDRPGCLRPVSDYRTGCLSLVKFAELNASPGASRLKRLVDSFVLGILGREAVTAAMH